MKLLLFYSVIKHQMIGNKYVTKYDLLQQSHIDKHIKIENK